MGLFVCLLGGSHNRAALPAAQLMAFTPQTKQAKAASIKEISFLCIAACSFFGVSILNQSKATPSTQRSINSKDWFDFTYLLISLCFILIKYFTPYCYNILLIPPNQFHEFNWFDEMKRKSFTFDLSEDKWMNEVELKRAAPSIEEINFFIMRDSWLWLEPPALTPPFILFVFPSLLIY